MTGGAEQAGPVSDTVVAGASQGTPESSTGGAGAVITVFRSRLRPDAGTRYEDTADRMLELARRMPGFIDFKVFQAEDGERVSIITFATPEDHRAWRDHPEHRQAQRLGRDHFYASYAVTVAEVRSARAFTA
jgi:heme-degrading monooxygenase HmoA